MPQNIFVFQSSCFFCAYELFRQKSLVTFMTLKMTVKLKIDNDIHPHQFCHSMND